MQAEKKPHPPLKLIYRTHLNTYNLFFRLERQKTRQRLFKPNIIPTFAFDRFAHYLKAYQEEVPCKRDETSLFIVTKFTHYCAKSTLE